MCDDLNDLTVMELCGLVGCPAEACEEVKQSADYISNIKGGYGAVRNIIERILRIRGEWQAAIDMVCGVSENSIINTVLKGKNNSHK